MPPLETTKVNIYRTAGTPNPSIDTIVGSDTTIVSGLLNWSVSTQGWSANRWTIYAIGFDLAGNDSIVGTDVDINITSNPGKVSDLVDWTVGDFGNVLIGTLNG